MEMTNRRNRLVYRLWAPIYDAVLGRLFRDGRARAMDVLALQPGERVAFIGIGTGADLDYLPRGVAAVGIDLSEAMLHEARKKLPVDGCDVELRVGDARSLPFDDARFDAVVLNLVLSVVPDPKECMAEALRILRHGGRLVVFDKFLDDEGELNLPRRVSNVFSTALGTDINRRLGDVLAGQPCEVAHAEPSILGGMYRVVLIHRV